MDVPARPAIVLLPSPFVGPATWRPAAAALRVRGWDVVEITHPAATPTGPADVAACFRGHLPGGPVVLVAHSNAGAHVPSLATGPDVVGAVFVDAVLPPATGEFALAPAELVARLAPMADDGLLPPWTSWFDDEDVAPLFPDTTTRLAVEAEQRRLPLDHLRATVPVPAGWDAMPTAYLAFGDTYAAERADAEGRGWPVRTIEGHHLHQLVDPAAVAAVIDEFLAWSGTGGTPAPP